MKNSFKSKAEKLVRKAEELMELSDYSGAEVILEKVLEKDSENVEAHYLLGWVTFMNGNPDLGRELFLLSLAKLPEVQTYCDLAVLENKQGNFEKAMEYANKAKEIEPESEMVQEVIGAIIYFRQLRQKLSSKIN